MFGKWKAKPRIENKGQLSSVAIIMDGNGRWAKRRMLPRNAGHAAGAKNVESVLRTLREFGVRYVTLYAFSTENWKRPKEEVDGLMELIYKYLDEVVLPRLKSGSEYTLRFIGDKTALPEKLREKCIEIENIETEGKFVCNLALNYGGRDEIVRAANMAIQDGHRELSEEILNGYMYTSGTPDPDLMIRTGGEYRISNFLLWQSAYTELYVTKTLWPDFGRADIVKAINSFNSRNRRYGGLDKDSNEK